MKAGVGACLLAAALGAAYLGIRLIPEQGETVSTPIYYDAVAYEDGFLTVGSKGTIEKINVNGQVKSLQKELRCDLLDVAADGAQALAVGNDGTAVMVADGRVSAYETESTALYSVCKFGEAWLLGGDDGILLQSADFRSWTERNTPAAGDITGLAATEDRCIGVTNRGEILISTDGVRWDLLNYNEYYGADLRLYGIEALDGTFWAYGEDGSGKSKIINSLEGGVWSERDLMVMEQSQELDLSDTKIVGLCSDGDQVIAALADGRALTMPSCAVCNKQSDISERPLGAVAYLEGMLLFAGEGYQLKPVEELRQERIQADAAYEKVLDGALMIDVRSKEEFAQQHIAGSINLPLDQISTQLDAICPDQGREIIFYCVSGKRSQQALETARSLGYQYVYNLGGIDAWTYGLSSG